MLLFFKVSYSNFLHWEVVLRKKTCRLDMFWFVFDLMFLLSLTKIFATVCFLYRVVIPPFAIRTCGCWCLTTSAAWDRERVQSVWSPTSGAIRTSDCMFTCVQINTTCAALTSIWLPQACWFLSSLADINDAVGAVMFCNMLAAHGLLLFKVFLYIPPIPPPGSFRGNSQV